MQVLQTRAKFAARGLAAVWQRRFDSVYNETAVKFPSGLYSGELVLMSMSQQVTATGQSTLAEFATGFVPADTGPRPKRWTRREYDKLVETGVLEGQRIELLGGEILEMSPQSYAHRQAILLTLKKLQEVFSEGYMVCPQLPLALGTDSEPEPDFSVVPGDDPRAGTQHPSHAVLVVEISLTTVGFDRTQKAILYAQAGIEDYWILNLQERQLEVYRQPSAGGYQQIEIVPAEGAVAPLAAPGRNVEVRELLP